MKSLAIEKTDEGYAIDLGTWKPEGMVPVVVVEVAGALKAEPLPIRPDATGVVTLEASDATPHGSARYESDKRCIGYWTDAAAWVGWDFRDAKPGRYSVLAEIACDPESGGAEVVFEIGGKPLTHTVAATKGWSDFVQVDLGEVEIAGGRTSVQVRAKTKPKLAVMNLRRVVLRPMK